IGDVSGHGLTAGLVMLMAQSAIGALVREMPLASPRTVLCAVNALLFENVRRRLGQDEVLTLSLLRYARGGRVVFAGAHEEMLVWRRQTGRCERLPTPGTWLAAMADVEPFLNDDELTLGDGDVLVMYTDGVTEAADSTGEQFGLDRLA